MVNQQNMNNVGNGQMLYVSFTLYGDNYWVSSPIPCDQADKKTIALADNVKNPSADVNSAISSGLFAVMKTKDAFYLITNDTAVAGYIFSTLHPEAYKKSINARSLIDVQACFRRSISVAV